MTVTKTDSFTYVGIDVSKHQLDLAYNTTEHKFLQVKNEENGFIDILPFLSKICKPFCIIESTGGYENNLTYFLIDQKIDFSIINPKRVREFAKAMGKYAKTDKIDALTLAKFGEAFKPEVFQANSDEQIMLRKKVKRRNQLIEFRTMEKCHIENENDPSILKSINDNIEHFTKEIKQIETEIKTLILKDQKMSKIKEILVSFKGISDTAAFILISELPELGNLGRKPIASLAGLAPYNNDSGMMKGKRRIKGGRGAVRKILYLVYMSACRYNTAIQKFKDRLKSNGVESKKIRGACMRKILVILNSMVKNNMLWNENFA
jgi:transposase